MSAAVPTADLLVAAIGASPANAARYAPHLAEGCRVYGIDTPGRLAAFLAQIGVESGALRWVREIWGPTDTQRRYEGRADLGNTQPGDGARFKGRGLIQTTGRANYASVTRRLRARGFDCPDFEAEPQALEEPRWACLSACDFWDRERLNALADAGQFVKIGRAINRGNPNSPYRANHEAERIALWARAKGAVGPMPQPAPETAATAPPAPLPVPQEPLVKPKKPWSDPLPVDPINAPHGEAMHPALIPFVAEALSTVVPKLGELFAKSDTAKRNVKALEIAANVAKDAIGARNEQEMVDTILTDEASAQRVREAIEANWFKLEEAREKSIAAAREFNAAREQLTSVRTVLGTGLTFIEFYSLVLTLGAFSGAAIVLFGDFANELKVMVVSLVLVAGAVATREFWLGGSRLDEARKAEQG